jgi:hypothetical protein
MRMAAENLTPVTLELGGKSPVILGPGYPLEKAAERIMVGKMLNAGQTCIAPDYVLVPAGREQAFVEAARAVVARCFPAMATTPDYTSIINERHYQRLQGYLGDAQQRGARIVPLSTASADATRSSPAAAGAAGCQRRDARDAGRDLRPAVAGPALCRPRRRDRLCEPASAPAGALLLRATMPAAATAC